MHKNDEKKESKLHLGFSGKSNSPPKICIPSKVKMMQKMRSSRMRSDKFVILLEITFSSFFKDLKGFKILINFVRRKILKILTARKAFKAEDP
jgi:hypothetical protein